MIEDSFKQRSAIGMYFVSLEEVRGELFMHQHGRITGQCNDHFICDIFSWVTGDQLHCDIRNEEQLSKTRLFLDKESLHEFIQKHLDASVNQ